MKPQHSNLGWLLLVNLVYALAALVAWPAYLFLLAARKKYRRRCWERWGLVPRFGSGTRRLWVHAISVGEVEAARTFIPALAEALPDHEVVLSTTTMTGRDRAARLFPGLPLFHFPLDLWPCVALALRRVRPAAVIQVESEWWPNFFLMAARRGIPVACVNVRITEKGWRGYRRIGRLMRAVFNSALAIGVQAEVYRERLLSLGADPRKIRVTGQMKHDGVTFADPLPDAEDLRREVGLAAGDTVLVAGSTGPGEEEMLLAAYAGARQTHPRLRLVIVPRRPENFDAAAQTILKTGFGVLRRSCPGRTEGPADRPPVILGDTMGELIKWYALADLVFVGRSLVPLGGSNPMEPGALGRPLVWGPHMFNFPVEAPALVAAGAATEVADAAALSAAILSILTRPGQRRQMGDAARDTIRALQGATARNVELVTAALSGTQAGTRESPT
jgi:3-deoxy-D-manno-octulosonic-acid transferase